MKTIQIVGVGSTVDADNASVTPGLPSGAIPGDLIVVMTSIRNSGTGIPRPPAGWKTLAMSGNVAVFGIVMPFSMTSMPSFSFVGGVAGATTIGLSVAFRFTRRDLDTVVHSSASQLNGSAQNIDTPALTITADGCAAMRLAWKQDDWSGVSNFGAVAFLTGRSTTTGDDAAQLIAAYVQTAAASLPVHTYTVSGGAAAISRGLMLSLLPYTSSWLSLDGSDEPCDFPAAFNAASNAACAAFTALQADISLLVNPPAARISAASGTDLLNNQVVFSSVDIDPTGLADLVADPDSVPLTPGGVWVVGHAVNVEYSGTDGNKVEVSSSNDSTFGITGRDMPASKNPPNGGGVVAVASVRTASYTSTTREGTAVYVTGAGVPAGLGVLKATQYMFRVSD